MFDTDTEPGLPAPVPAAAARALVPPGLSASLESALSYAKDATSGRTQVEYARAFELFKTWCGLGEVEPLPATVETTAAYLADLADRKLKAATIDLHLAAIAWWHRNAGYDSPTDASAVRKVRKGIRNRIGTKPDRKAPATTEIVKRMLKRLPDTLIGKRDAALLAIGFAAAMRRSELVALRVSDVERKPEGIILHIGKSKTDQEGEGHEIAVPSGSKLKPVAALDEWLSASGITEGPIFRPIGKGSRIGKVALSDRSAAQIVKDSAVAIGMDPNFFAGHSLRSGFVTSALEAGADILKVMDVTRHTQVQTLKRYDRRAQAFKNHAGRGIL